MSSKLLSSQIIIYHSILFLCFCLSVNYFTDLKIINFTSYVIFHLTLIYLAFYFFNFILFFIYFLYGVFFDIFLINFISPHLICFLIFILLFYLMKKLLVNISSFKIAYIILIISQIMFFMEALIANMLFNYPVKFYNLGILSLITIIIFIPLLSLFSKIDKI